MILSAVVAASGLSLQAKNPIPDDCRIGGWAIGCQAFTFNQFSALEAIEKTAQAGGKIIKSQGFDGNISIEYEYNWNNNVPDVTKCIDFVRAHGAK